MSFKKRLRDFSFLGNPLSDRKDGWLTHQFKTEATTRGEIAKIEARAEAEQSIMREALRQIKEIFWMEQLGGRRINVRAHTRRKGE